jgi:hypothetical protein
MAHVVWALSDSESEQLSSMSVADCEADPWQLSGSDSEMPPAPQPRGCIIPFEPQCRGPGRPRGTFGNAAARALLRSHASAVVPQRSTLPKQEHRPTSWEPPGFKQVVAVLRDVGCATQRRIMNSSKRDFVP